MSNDNWRFSPDDLGDDGTSTTTETSNSSGSSSLGNSLGSGLFLLPLSIVAVYAFVAKATVLTAVEGIVGTGALALAITNAFWIGGVIVAGILAVLAILTALSLLGALVKRSGATAVFGVLGCIYFGAGYAGATYLFSGVPLLVGFILTTNLLIYGGILLLLLVVGAGAIIAMP